MAGADVDSHLRGRPTQRVLSEDVTFTATGGQGHVHLPTFWIDSGAGPTIINRHVVNSLGWLTETTEQYLVFANGRRSGPVEKLLDGLTLTFNGEWEVRTRTYVNEARDYDGLLGNRAGHALSLFVVPITQRAYLLPRLAEGDTSTVASVRVATHVPRFDEPMGVVYADTPITRTDCSLYFCALGQLDLQLDGKLEALGSVHHPVSRAERESTATEYAPIKRENSVCTVLRASTRPFASPAARGAAVHPSNPLASTMPSNSQPDGVTTHSAVAVQGADVDSLPELEPYSSDSEDDYALQSTTVRWAARYSMLPPPDPEHGGYGCRRPTQTTSATATIATTSGAAESLDSEAPASPTGSLRPCSPHLLLAPRCCAPHHHSWSTMQMIAVPSSSIHQPLPLYTLSFLNWLQPVVVSTQPLAQPYRWAALPPRTRGHHGTTVPLPSGHYHPYPLGAPAHTRSMTLLSGLFHSLSRGQASTSWRRQS